MPRAESALSLAPLHLSAVVGAATLRGRGSPPPSGYPWEKAQGLTWRHGTLTATTLCAQPEGEEWRRPDLEGGRPCGLRGSLPPARGGASTTSFGFRLLVAATLAMRGWLDLTQQGLAPCKKHQVSLAH
jgi:hypothetical protein